MVLLTTDLEYTNDPQPQMHAMLLAAILRASFEVSSVIFGILRLTLIVTVIRYY